MEDFSQNISQDQFPLLLLSWLSTSCLQSNILILINILKNKQINHLTSTTHNRDKLYNVLHSKPFTPTRVSIFNNILTFTYGFNSFCHGWTKNEDFIKQAISLFFPYVCLVFFSFCHRESNYLKPTFQTSVKTMTQFISNYDFVSYIDNVDKICFYFVIKWKPFIIPQQI